MGKILAGVLSVLPASILWLLAICLAIGLMAAVLSSPELIRLLLGLLLVLWMWWLVIGYLPRVVREAIGVARHPICPER